jgi:hypothetical protein
LEQALNSGPSEPQFKRCFRIIQKDALGTTILNDFTELCYKMLYDGLRKFYIDQKCPTQIGFWVTVHCFSQDLSLFC